MKCGIIVVYFVHTLFFLECEQTPASVEEESVENRFHITGAPFDPKDPPAKSPQFEREVAAGTVPDIFAPNQHLALTDLYRDLGRRFVPQYPYHEKDKQTLENNKAEEILHRKIQDSKAKYESDDMKLLPVKASPEFVLAVAKESKMLEDSKPHNPTNEVINKHILRTGDYWNDVYIEDMNPNILRTGDLTQKKKVGSLPRLGSVRTKIMPGTRLYKLISVLKRVSPKFLYVMNVN